MNNRQALMIAAAMRQPSTTHVHVEQKRAPTDDSVRLFKEFREKAEADIIKSTAVSANTFNCVVQTHADALSDRLVMRAVFDLNGEKMTAEATAERWRENASVDAVRKLRDEIAREIANRCIEPAIGSLNAAP